LPAALVALADLDAPRLGLLPYGDGEVQHAVAVIGLDGVNVQALAEDQLTAEPSLRALRDEDLRPIVRPRARAVAVALGLPKAALPPCSDGKGVALDVDVDRVGLYAGKVHRHVINVPLAPHVHRHGQGHPRPRQQLAGDPVQVSHRPDRLEMHH
jgi:hypothetical protein